MEFDYGLDLNVVTNDVRNKLDVVKSYMPAGAGDPIIFKLSTDMIPVMVLTATADQSLPALYKILDDKVGNFIFFILHNPIEFTNFVFNFKQILLSTDEQTCIAEQP